MQIYIFRKRREGAKERLKLKTHKIKNKRKKNKITQTKKPRKWKIREIFSPTLEKVFFFHHLIFLASVQIFLLHSGGCGFLAFCPCPGVPVPSALPLVFLAKAMELCKCWQDDRRTSEPQGMGTALVCGKQDQCPPVLHRDWCLPQERLPGA